MIPSPFSRTATLSPAPPCFLETIAPLIRRGRDRLRAEAARLGRHPDAPFAPAAIEEALSLTLTRQLAPLFDPLCRSPHPLEGGCSILEEYPLLAIQAELAINRWAAFSTEFLRHLCEDWQALRAVFRPAHEAGPVVAVDAAGQRHRGGRTVLIVQFRSGWRLVYKPRGLAVEEHFQQLLDWLNERGACPVLGTMPVLDRGGHGWSAFTTAATCTSEDEVHRYCKRLGAYRALLHGLVTGNCHLERAIAAGEHPVLVDLEGLFLRGRAGAAGQRPLFRGAPVPLFDYRADVIDGFQTMYRLLWDRRHDLLAATGPLGAFSGDEVRFLARPMRFYTLLLRRSYQPDLLRDGRARERFFARLGTGAKEPVWRTRLHDAERSDLQRGDIPLFTTHPGSRHLWTGTGERFADFFRHTGLERVRRRLARLGQADLDRQLAILGAASGGC